MSQRQVWSCDLCGKDIDKKDVRTFYAGSTATTMTPTRDVGPCCFGQPIERLVMAFAIDRKGKP